MITLSENDQHKHYPVSSPDPAEAIKFRMAQADLKPAVCSDKLYRLMAKRIIMSEFSGVTQRGLTFLQQLSQNNNKEWFDEHRGIYDEELLKPVRQLVADLAQDMLIIDELFEIRPAVGKTISRMHRDTRFSRDKSLYRSNIWLTFKRSRKNWTDAPTYFFEFGPDWWRYGLGYYSASRITMNLFRERLLQDPAAFLNMSAAIPDNFVLEGESYKRELVKGMQPELSQWYNKKSWALISEQRQMDLLFSPQLVPVLAAGFQQLAPLYDFLMKIEAQKRLQPAL